MKRGKAVPCRGQDTCKALEVALCWCDGGCGGSRVSRGRGAGAEIREAKGAHVGPEDLDLF